MFDDQLDIKVNFRIHRMGLMTFRQNENETTDEFVSSNVLARHALSRYDNAFLQNDNAFLSFQITPISMSNNCIFWRYE